MSAAHADSSESWSTPRVGFIGLGTMGRGMAASVLAAGLPLRAYDVNPAAVAAAVAQGAIAAPTLRELGTCSDIVMVAVFDELQVRHVVLGGPDRDGVLAGLAPGSIVLIHSTVHPDACVELAQICNQHEVHLLDAPMTGSPLAAAAGALSLMVGGPTEVVRRAEPVLDAISRMVTHMGPVGSGLIAKLVNNAIIAVNMCAVDEALRLAGAFGIEGSKMLTLVDSGGAQSWVGSNWSAIGKTSATYPGGSKGLTTMAHKDLSLALELAHRGGVSLPAVALSTQLIAKAYDATAASAQSAAPAHHSAPADQQSALFAGSTEGDCR